MVGLMDKAGELESFILDKISETRLPGVSLAVVKDSELIYARGFGFRDIESGLPASPDTLYGIGSVTKSFTALAIMQLVEEGKLSLEDPVERYVPLKLRPFKEPVRIHHLLTHSSGIPALAYAEAFIRGFLGDPNSWLPVAKPEDVLTFMKDAEEWAVAKPGEKFFYLNEGYVLLGYIVSKISGIKYEDYVVQRILKPLDMHRTFFYGDKAQSDPDKATPYIIDEDKKIIVGRFPHGITSDGGLISNVVDLSKYISMYLNKGEYKGRKIVAKEYIDMMETPYIEVPFRMFGGEGYGYGWIITPDFHGRKLVSHSGSVLVYTAYVGYMPEEKIGVAVLANGNGYPPSYIGLYTLALMLGLKAEDLPFLKMERLLKKLEGVYESYKGTLKAEVKRRNGYLTLGFKGKYMAREIPLFPEKKEDNVALFYTISGVRKLEVEFRFKEDGVELLYERYKLVKHS